MSVRKNRTRGVSGTPRHVRLHHWLLESAAYRSLRPVARALLVELYAFYNGTNNGQIYPGVRLAAERVGVSVDTIWPAFKDLEDRGFIRAVERGAFTRKDRQATRWVLTEFEHAGQLATKDFMRYVPRPKAPRKKQKSVGKIRTNSAEITYRGLQVVK